MTTPTTPMRSVAVLGAGTMGAQIAAHLANAGVPVAPARPHRRRRARRAEARARAEARSVLHARRRRADHDRRLRRRPLAGSPSVDWIIEAVVEQLDVKRALLERVDAVRRPGTIVTSNTSGIPIAALAEGRSDDFRRHWLGTHFFNPPRYLRLLEVIPTRRHRSGGRRPRRALRRSPPRQGRRRREGHAELHRQPHRPLRRDRRCFARSRPGEYTIEEIDAITGPAIGRPKSATFRTMDIAGLDILCARGEEPASFELPAAASRSLVERGWIGEKAGQGFYKRETTDPGVRDPHARSRHARRIARSSRRGCRRSMPRDRSRTSRERIRTLFLGEGQGRRVPARHAGPDAALHGAGRAGHRALDRRRRPRDAVGLRLGAGPVRDHRRDRRPNEVLGGDRSTAAARARSHGRRNRFRDDGVPPAAPDLQILRVREGSPARRPQERRRQPRRPRRRRAGARVPLEDERHRRRHDPDAARRREGGGRELRRARRRQRRAELLRRRQPDAAAARSAGRQLGRDRPDGPRVPGRDAGAALRRRAGRSSRRPA